MSVPALSPEAASARRLGLLGGSFDPPHAGHLHVARSARRAFELDHVLFVPARSSPHKPGRPPAPDADRLALLALLLRGEPRVSVWAGELQRPPPSYTIDTVRELQAELASGAELFLLLGSDNLAGLATWREADELLRRVRPIVVLRAGSELDPALFEGLSHTARERLRAGLLALEPCAGASSEIRRALARGADPGPALPPALRAYVKARGLYRGPPEEEGHGR